MRTLSISYPRRFRTCVVLLALSMMPALAFSMDDPPPSVLQISPQDEPGTPMRIVGVVKEEGTGQPVAGAKLYVYQTDASGVYGPEDDPADPRLSGTLVTDGDGRFELLSIRPESYPGTRIAKHVHYVLTKAGHDRVVGEILFDDDPFLTERARAGRGGHAIALVTPRMDERGVARCEAVLWIGSE